MIKILKRFFKYYRLRKIDVKLTFKSTKNLSFKGLKLGRQVNLIDVRSIGENVSIGDYSYINVDTMICSGNIGRFCSIGYDCIIGADEHPTEYLLTHPIIYDNSYNMITNKVKFIQENPPIIKDNVWIGAKTIIKRGVEIGEGCIIGANSFVNKDIPPYSIAAGSPVRIIKNRKETCNFKDINMEDVSTEEIINLLMEEDYSRNLGKVEIY
ncbi:CatB-related O-acetyltransferase [Paraclostridium bifermentans]|uniref:CatB-related O-acetyltransferase n=1 Tax=Paraclostridium bifermentans TaxID=1490 RepID=UPI0034DE8949